MKLAVKGKDVKPISLKKILQTVWVTVADQDISLMFNAKLGQAVKVKNGADVMQAESQQSLREVILIMHQRVTSNILCGKKLICAKL